MRNIILLGFATQKNASQMEAATFVDQEAPNPGARKPQNDTSQVFRVEWLVFRVEWLVFRVEWLVFRVEWLVFRVEWLVFRVEWLVF